MSCRWGWRARGVGLLLMAGSACGCVPDYGPSPVPLPEPFPNLNQAEANLQAAIGSLRAAPPVFAGHKAEAVRLIEAAINELEMAKASAP